MYASGPGIYWLGGRRRNGRRKPVKFHLVVIVFYLKSYNRRLADFVDKDAVSYLSQLDEEPVICDIDCLAVQHFHSSEFILRASWVTTTAATPTSYRSAHFEYTTLEVCMGVGIPMGMGNKLDWAWEWESGQMGVWIINAYRVPISSHVASHYVIVTVHCHTVYWFPTNANFYNNRCCMYDMQCWVRLMCDWDYASCMQWLRLW